MHQRGNTREGRGAGLAGILMVHKARDGVANAPKHAAAYAMDAAKRTSHPSGRVPRAAHRLDAPTALHEAARG